MQVSSSVRFGEASRAGSHGSGGPGRPWMRQAVLHRLHEPGRAPGVTRRSWAGSRAGLRAPSRAGALTVVSRKERPRHGRQA